MDGGALKRWWQSLGETPEPLTRPERYAFALGLMFVAVTRLDAVSLTLWDWDEALFALAVRDYDVTAYHPHPPGFPLFIALAKLLPLPPFSALQAIVVLSSLALFPLAFALARELRAGKATAFASAAILPFLPNVWFYGGTAFSDVPALILGMGAAVFLLRGCRSPRAALLGGLLLGAGAAIRPQNLLLGLAPLLVLTLWRRRAGVAAAVIAAAIVLAAFGAAAHASGGWHAYRHTVASHASYIRQHDTFLSPERPSLLRVADDFFVRPFRAPFFNVVLSLLCAVSLLRLARRPHLLAAAATFGPFLLFAWLNLDFHSVSRFSLGYMPLFAIFAADALPRKVRIAGAALLGAAMFVWAWPAISDVRTTTSPPVAAAGFVRRLPPAATVVYVGESLGAHAALLLPEYERRYGTAPPLATAMSRANVIALIEGRSGVRGARNFTREDGRLAGVARARYFDVAAVPVEKLQFGDGWYGEEGRATAPFRWMGQRGTVALPAGSREVSIRFTVPQRVRLVVATAGRTIDVLVVPGGTVERTWKVSAAAELTLAVDAVTRAPGDPRPLGLRLDSMEVR